MLKLFVNGIDRSEHLSDGSLSVTDQMQNKANTATFDLNSGVALPSENQEVKFFDCVGISDVLPASSLWANWRMDEGSGTSMFDSSGNGRHGSIVGATYDAGKRNQGLLFDGTDYVTLPDVASLPTAEITVSAWVKATPAGGQRIIWADYSSVGGWIMYGDATNWVFGIVSAGPTQNLVVTPHGSDGEWHHLCGTYDGATQRLYYDGDEVGVPKSHVTSLIQSGTFRLSHDAWDTFAGMMDEIRIYSVALTAGEVKLLATGSELSLKDSLRSGLSILDFGKYRVGENIYVGVDGSGEERALITSIDAGSSDEINVGLSRTLLDDHSTGDLAGKKVFAGTLTYVLKKNPHLLSDVECQCSATDYTKIFDRKLINDSWTDYDARQIINDALDTTVNHGKELDDMEYADNAAVQAEWIESGDGDNPTVETTDFIQGSSSVLLPWTNAGGSAAFSGTPVSADLSDLTGAGSGAPAKGNVTFWYRRSGAAGISSVSVRVGSDVGNYTSVSFVPENDTDWHFISLPLVDGSETGNPVWTAADYLAVVIAETTSSSLLIDDIRITAYGSFTMYGFEETGQFDEVRASFKKPTVFIDTLAKALNFYWFIDYDKDIHFFIQETNDAPFSIHDTSDNFLNLEVNVDTSQLKNRQVVRGGTKTSDSVYRQVVQGDGATREWILKSKFKNLTVDLDDNSSTDVCEEGTNGTTVNATLHGLSNGDWIVNRTRFEVREVTVVNPNQFTVANIPGQAVNDIFSKFDTAQAVGVEFLDDETGFDYVSNYNEKSIRASSVTVAPSTGDYLLFSFNEIIPIRIQSSDNASIMAMKAIVGGDGIFDGAVITDDSLDSTQAARDRARAEIVQYSNPIVEIGFRTNHEGLSGGQLMSISDSEKGISDTFVVQSVRSRWTGDFPVFDVRCASSVFGIIEYFQKLSRQVNERLIDEDEIIDQILGEEVEISVSDSHSFVPSESTSESVAVSVGTSDSVSDRDITTDPYVWQPDASDARYNLAQYG